MSDIHMTVHRAPTFAEAQNAYDWNKSKRDASAENDNPVAAGRFAGNMQSLLDRFPNIDKHRSVPKAVAEPKEPVKFGDKPNGKTMRALRAPKAPVTDRSPASTSRARMN